MKPMLTLQRTDQCNRVVQQYVRLQRIVLAVFHLTRITRCYSSSLASTTYAVRSTVNATIITAATVSA
jgi:hypothetical protein